MPIAINSEKTVGTIIAGGYDTSLNVNGYLKCDGSLVSRTTFSRLFGVIGTTYGNGDGSTTFALPDLEGVVPRGAGTSKGYTQNITVTLGTKQNDAFQGHFMNLGFSVQNSVQSGSFTRVSHSPNEAITRNTTDFPTTDNTNGTPRTANETRVKNLGVVFYIKY
jgi:microcystin-dependent protein